jgi:uncharacterized protein YndB with AHSA1/START domain
MALDPQALAMRPHVEAYEHVGEIDGWVHDLERRWQEEDARARVFVAPDQTIVAKTYEVAAPPAVAWEFLTTPGRRVLWMAGVTDVIQDAPGNRRSVGTTNHCMHGKDAVVEEVLDWRPYDYFTVRSTVQTPAGPVKIVNTTELEPTASGTRVTLRFAKSRSARERALVEPLVPAFEAMIAAGSASLRTIVAAEAIARAAASPDEPAVPAPSPDRPFSGLQPITYVG